MHSASNKHYAWVKFRYTPILPVSTGVTILGRGEQADGQDFAFQLTSFA